VDVSQSGSNPSIIREVLELILADTAIELVIIQEDAGILLKYFPLEWVQDINTVFVDFRTKQDKPLVVVSPPGAADLQRLEIEQKLTQASIPVFPTMERAARAISNLNRYYRLQETVKS
jgi:acyl-CoA synthetase (NDP forming)